MLPNILLSIVLLSLTSSNASAHMMMSSPPPRQSKANPGLGGAIDYSYTSPLSGLGAFPCKGYPAQASVATVAAGSSIPVTLSGGAPHDGGHCQFALSYNGDQNWVVIDTIIRECVRHANPMHVNVPIPANAPAGKATFMWTWINAVGNREYYTSCSDIEITNPNASANTLIGPELLIANLPGYPLIPEFPGSQPDRRELFASRQLVTVTRPGPVSATSTSQPAATSTAPPFEPTQTSIESDSGDVTVTVTVTRTVYVTAPASPLITSPPAATSSPAATCTDGAHRCEANGTAWGVCDHGAWVSGRPVPGGTVCTQVGDTIAFQAA